MGAAGSGKARGHHYRLQGRPGVDGSARAQRGTDRVVHHHGSGTSQVRDLSCEPHRKRHSAVAGTVATPRGFGRFVTLSFLMASVPFVKASACGNDFLIIAIEHAPVDIAAFSRQICDRHNGVGADGVEWVLPTTGADLGIRLINADGSGAEISGNGTRCVAAWYCSEHECDAVRIRTDAGVKTCELMARVGNTFEFRTAMGKPDVVGEHGVTLQDRVLNGIA